MSNQNSAIDIQQRFNNQKSKIMNGLALAMVFGDEFLQALARE